MSSECIFIIMLIVLLWANFIGLYFIVLPNYGRAPVEDIGLLWVLILCLYSTFPPLTWLLQGGTHPAISGRLFLLQPVPSEIVYLLGVALAYSVGFSVAYGTLMYNSCICRDKFIRFISNRYIIGTMFVLLVATMAEFLINNSGLIRRPESYSDSYLVIAELSTGMRQLIKMIDAVSGFASIIMIVAAFQRCSKSNKYKLFIVLYMLLMLFSYNLVGQRSKLFINMFMIAVSYHVIVKPFPAKLLVPCGIVGLSLFNYLGAIRGLREGADYDLVFGIGEFDMLWGNAVELLRDKIDGNIDLPLYLRFEEFYSFIPSQFLWIDKIDLSTWYVTNYYGAYADAGGGLAFGAISQAVVGDGMPEAFIRGVILGLLAMLTMKWLNKKNGRWWYFPVQLALLVLVYHSIRSTTFSQLASLVQIYIPTIITIEIIGQIGVRAFKSLNEK